MKLENELTDDPRLKNVGLQTIYYSYCVKYCKFAHYDCEQMISGEAPLLFAKVRARAHKLFHAHAALCIVCAIDIISINRIRYLVYQ
jgi:hypothetical protein